MEQGLPGWNRFGAELRRLRQARGISLGRMAELIHYSKGYLSKIENGQRVPTAELARLCDQVLLTDGVLTELAAGGRRARKKKVPRPAQLPAPVTGFTGRMAALDQLTCLRGAGDGTPVAVICGPPGIGKTALAVHWSQLFAAEYPDGSLFADLRGYDRVCAPADPEEILEGFLRVLGAGAESAGRTVTEKSAALRTALDGRRMLLVLDDAATPAQVRPLLPGSPGCVVLVTSRSTMAGLVVSGAATRITLDPFSEQESAGLLRQIIGAERVDEEPRACRDIAARCGHLPLALRLAADRAVTWSWLTLADLAARLASRDRRLDLLSADDDPDTAVRSVIAWSYRALPSDIARVFRLLSLHDGREISAPAAAAIAGAPVAVTSGHLEALTVMHLLQRRGNGRYAFHDLIRMYAAEQAGLQDAARDRAACVRRMLSWYLHTADAADSVLQPHRKRLPLDAPDPLAPPLRFDGYNEAFAWCEAERANFVCVTRQASAAGADQVAWQLPNALWSYFNIRTPWSEWVACYSLALASATRCGAAHGQARILRGLGALHGDLNRLGEAIGYFRRAYRVSADAGDSRGMASSLQNLGAVYCDQGSFEEAVAAHSEALVVFREVADRRSEAVALKNIGRACQGLDRLGEAGAHLRDALAICSDLGDSFIAADCICLLAENHRLGGDRRAAIENYQKVVSIGVEFTGPLALVRALGRLGVLYEQDGQIDRAAEAARRAELLLAEYADPHPEEPAG